MNTKNTYFILNPASAGGKTGHNQKKIIRYIKKFYVREYTLTATSKPLQAIELSRTAIKKGFQTIVVIGGDGTINEVVNGFFENRELINPDCQLGIINCGTGCGLAQSLNLPTQFHDQLRVIKNANSQKIDIGKIKYTNGNGQKTERYFVNEFQAGIGGTVVKKLQSGRKCLGGFLAFGLTTVLSIFQQPNQNMILEFDETGKLEKRFLGVMIGNGSYTGGGMRLTPAAKLNDRQLDVLVMHEQNIQQRLVAFSKIYSGKHIKSPLFSYFQAQKISMDSEEHVHIAADGELLGRLPCEVEIVPDTIQVCSKNNEVQS